MEGTLLDKKNSIYPKTKRSSLRAPIILPKTRIAIRNALRAKSILLTLAPLPKYL